MRDADQGSVSRARLGKSCLYSGVYMQAVTPHLGSVKNMWDDSVVQPNTEISQLTPARHLGSLSRDMNNFLCGGSLGFLRFRSRSDNKGCRRHKLSFLRDEFLCVPGDGGGGGGVGVAGSR